MRKTHDTPEVMKTKLRADFSVLNELKNKVALTEQMIQDYIGGYVLGAGLPTTDLKFDENFNLTYEVVSEAELGEEIGEDPDQEVLTAEMAVSKSPSQAKKKVR